MFDILKERMREHSDRIAIVSGGKEHTYSELLVEVENKERLFSAQGIGSGHVVVLVGEFSLPAIASLLALFFLKATAVPLTKEAKSKLQKFVELLNVDFIVSSLDSEEGEVINHGPQLSPGEWRNILPAESGGLIVFTSGSTGLPKAILHNIDSLCYRYLEPKEPISSICFLLFDHMGGINTLLFLLFRGGTAVNVSERQVDIVCEAVQRYKVQLLPTTPSFLSQLLMARAYQNYDLSSLKVISYGTEVMSEVVLQKLNVVLPQCILKQTYGLSETGVLQIKSESNDTLWFKFIDKGVEIKIIDNVLWIKTKSNLLGKILFTDNGVVLEETSDDWFCTNDLVEVKGKYLKILGRQTDIINVGGLKVYPSEVENCLHELDFVSDVFVKGKKHVLLGQIVVAYILLDDKKENAEAEKLLRRHCLSKLEKYKVPSQFIFNWGNFVNDRFKKVRTP